MCWKYMELGRLYKYFKKLLDEMDNNIVLFTIILYVNYFIFGRFSGKLRLIMFVYKKYFYHYFIIRYYY